MPSKQPALNQPLSQPAGMLGVTRRATFCAAHFYWFNDWSEAENHARFKGCANRHGHGHNYVLELTVSGPLNAETGMLVNLKDLKTLIDTHVIQVLDHKNLNYQIPFFATRLPTLENLLQFIARQLFPELEKHTLQPKRLTLWENESLFATILPEGRAA